MKSLTASDASAVMQDTTRWAICIKVFEDDSDAVRLTSHDRNLTVSLSSDPLGLSGEYTTVYTANPTEIRGTADMAVDNLEVDALLDAAGITRQDIRTGVFDDVRYVIFITKWDAPTDSGIVLKRGVVGNIRDFLEDLATFELRGFKQYLAQTITQAAGPTCRYILGDANCGVDLSLYEQTGEVIGVTSQRRIIEATLDGSEQDAGWFTGGVLTWTSGANAGLSIEIKSDAGSGAFTFLEPVPFDIAITDTFTATPGCNKSLAVSDGVASGDCAVKFLNVVNFGGEPFMPSQNSLVEAPNR